ncbi:MAG: acetyltransferase [Candidatus Eremiobacterota bacterium]
MVILGAGGHGREVAEIVRDCPGLEPVGFVDEHPELKGQLLDDLPVLGGFEWFKRRRKILVLVAVGTPSVCRRLAERVGELGLDFAAAISPMARISPRVVLGRGVVAFPGVVVNTGARIGDHGILNVGVSVSHDAVVGRWCNLNPGSRLAGNVTIEDGCYLGMGCHVIQGRRVGEWTTVGAGAAVVRDLPAHATAVGVPARVIKRPGDAGRTGRTQTAGDGASFENVSTPR